MGARHCCFLFCDGHAESALRRMVIDPTNLTWQRRWNNDHDPYLELGNWAVDWTQAAAVGQW